MTIESEMKHQRQLIHLVGCIVLCLLFFSCSSHKKSMEGEKKQKYYSLFFRVADELFNREFQKAMMDISEMDKLLGSKGMGAYNTAILKAEYYQEINDFKNMEKWIQNARKRNHTSVLKEVTGVDYFDYVMMMYLAKCKETKAIQPYIDLGVNTKYLEDVSNIGNKYGSIPDRIAYRAVLVDIMTLPFYIPEMKDVSEYYINSNYCVNRFVDLLGETTDRDTVISLLAEIYGFVFIDGEFHNEMIFNVNNNFSSELGKLIMRCGLKRDDLNEIKKKAVVKKVNSEFEKYWSTLW